MTNATLGQLATVKQETTDAITGLDVTIQAGHQAAATAHTALLNHLLAAQRETATVLTRLTDTLQAGYETAAATQAVQQAQLAAAQQTTTDALVGLTNVMQAANLHQQATATAITQLTAAITQLTAAMHTSNQAAAAALADQLRTRLHAESTLPNPPSKSSTLQQMREFVDAVHKDLTVCSADPAHRAARLFILLACDSPRLAGLSEPQWAALLAPACDPHRPGARWRSVLLRHFAPVDGVLHDALAVTATTTTLRTWEARVRPLFELAFALHVEHRHVAAASVASAHEAWLHLVPQFVLALRPKHPSDDWKTFSTLLEQPGENPFELCFRFGDLAITSNEAHKPKQGKPQYTDSGPIL